MGISHVGHSIGLELHEQPMLTQDATGMVESGMIFCIEAVIPAVRMEVPVWYHFEQLVEVADGEPKRVAGPTPFEILSIRG
jgi:Xaa-Pro aminopeptidase